MTYRGKVQHGVIVLQEGIQLADGTEVTVAPMDSAQTVDPGTGAVSLWKELTELGRSGETRATNLPSDLALNHDHYLHGLPKRK